MDWKLFILVIVTAARDTYGHPGVRTPPTELQEKFIKDTEVTVETNETKIQPILTDGRYLNETPSVSKNRRNLNITDVDMVINMNNSSMLVTPLPVSRINIYNEYQLSTNYIVNEFLRKNIINLLNDGFESRHLVESPGFMDNDTLVHGDENEKNETDSVDLEKLVKEYYQINDDNQQNLQQNNGWLSDKVEYPANNLLKQYYTQLYTSALPQYSGFSTLSNPLTNAYIDNTTPNPYFMSNKIPTTVLTDSNLSSIIVKKKKRKPPYITSNYDPADPDPYYENQPDVVSSILQYTPPFIGGTKIGATTQMPNFQQEQIIQQDNLVTQQHCPGVKVVLNDQISLNLRPEIGPCSNVKVNLNNEQTEPPAPPKSETSLFAGTPETSKRKRKRKRRPSKTKRRRRRKPSSGFIEHTVTQAVPIVAHIPAVVAPTAASIPQRRKPLKFKRKKLKKLRKYKKWLKKFKGFGGIFLKVILFFTVANPIAFSFWTMLFSPLAVLIAGGSILAMVLYPLGSALLSSTAHKHSHGYNHAIVIHKHRRPHKWRREDNDVNWGQWRRSDQRIPMYFEDRSEHSSILDNIENFLKGAIERFNGQM